MSLNEAPVNINTMAQLHGIMRDKLMSTKGYSNIIPPTAVTQMDQFHLEYWILSDQHPNPWIFITIGNLFHPEIRGSFNTQVVATIPNEVWDDEKYSELHKKLQITDPYSQERDMRFEQVVSRELSKYSFSRGVAVRDNSRIKPEAFKEYSELKFSVNKLIKAKQEIITSLKKVFDEYLQNQF